MELKEVHSDERRKISVINDLLPDKREFSIIHLNAGKAIGGCIHKNDEHFLILKGIVKVMVGENKMVCPEGYKGLFFGNVPHGFYSEEESIICEWGITEQEKIDSEKNEVMLKEINEINAS